MKYNAVKEKGNTYKIEVTLDKSKVQEAFKEALEHEREHIKVDGFREGKAPLDVVKDKIDKGKLNGHALNHLLSYIYSTLIKENKYQPIVNPMFDVKAFDENSDLNLVVTIIEKPSIKVGDYKSILKDVKKEPTKEELEKTQNPLDIVNAKIIEAINKAAEIDLSEGLVIMEKDRMLQSLSDQVKGLGKSLKEYLESQKKTVEEIEKQYEETARKVLISDFVLTEISNLEGISISDEEINATIAAVPDEKSREALSKPDQKAYIKAVLKKAKTIEKLKEYTS